MKTKSALSYFGSDSEVASRLAGLINDRKHCTIVFAGGLSILPHLEARAVVANDLNGLAISFYRILSGRLGTASSRELIAMCEKTLSHPDEMRLASEVLESRASDDVDRAWAYWALCWIGRKGQGGTKKMGGLPSVRRKADGGNNASRLRAAAGDLEAWAEHFRRCEFESVDFRKLLPKVADDETCSIYCDPPFWGAGGNYLYSFVEQDHRDLRECLGRFRKTKVLVRYDDCAEARELYRGWEVVEGESRDQANQMKGELWLLSPCLF